MALLATTLSFAATGTGTVKVTVVYPSIEVTNPSDIIFDMNPGQTSGTQTMTFGLEGALGIGFSISGGAWSYPTGFTTADVTPLPAGGTFDSNDGSASVSYEFTVTCAAGTQRKASGETYDLTYTFTIDY